MVYKKKKIYTCSYYKNKDKIKLKYYKQQNKNTQMKITKMLTK